MKYFKKMTGAKCYLSPISLDDAARYTEWLNDTEVTRNLSISGMNITLNSELEILEKISKEHNYAIVDLNSDMLIGTVGLTAIDQRQGTAEIGVFIGDKSYWNKGYGEEAMRLLLRYAFDYLNLRNIMLRVFDYNKAGIRCYEKIGFKEIGKRRNAIRLQMKEHDLIFMDILNDELN